MRKTRTAPLGCSLSVQVLGVLPWLPGCSFSPTKPLIPLPASFLFPPWSYVSWLVSVAVLGQEASCPKLPNQMTFCGGHQQENLSQTVHGVTLLASNQEWGRGPHWARCPGEEGLQSKGRRQDCSSGNKVVIMPSDKTWICGFGEDPLVSEGECLGESSSTWIIETSLLFSRGAE